VSGGLCNEQIILVGADLLQDPIYMLSYTKNLVAQFGEECNVIVMCWGPGQSSQFHAHEGSRCFVKVLSGCLLEQQVPYPNEGATDCALGERRRLNTDQVCYIDDSIGAHKVSNVSTVMPAVSLHIYMPAYTSCRLFEPEATDKSTCLSIERSHTVNVTFDNVQQHS